MKKIITCVYEAKDGTKFDNESECARYEMKMTRAEWAVDMGFIMYDENYKFTCNILEAYYIRFTSTDGYYRFENMCCLFDIENWPVKKDKECGDDWYWEPLYGAWIPVDAQMRWMHKLKKVLSGKEHVFD